MSGGKTKRGDPPQRLRPGDSIGLSRLDKTTKPEQERARLAPTRERGRRRVETILAAASEIFAEKGVGASTMAEVAARSATHVGSLYRFFPTKEALADALLERYVARVRQGNAALIERAGALSAPAFAASFLDLMLDLRADRAIAVQIAAGDDENGTRRRRIVSDMMFDICERGVRTVLPSLTAARAATVAQMLLYFGKMVVLAADDESSGRPSAVAELRWIASRYLDEQNATSI